VAPTPAASEHATAAPVRPPPARTPIAAAPPVTQPAPGARPSFDCGKARSRPERLICSDAELARLDRELGRLNVKARSLSQDPVAFRRAGDRAWKRRETECSDKACLLAWYAQRREHLQALVDAAGPAREAGG
jgi:uncharacterized protein